MSRMTSVRQNLLDRDLDGEALADDYRSVRRSTEMLCETLEPEDCCIQSMPDVSPTKWHLAHTSWFFETFVVKKTVPDYRSPSEAYDYLFNSYYNAVGRQYARSERGLLSRPTLVEVMEYRAHVDRAMETFFESAAATDRDDNDLLTVVETGLHHEQQHQELMLMDIKHVFSRNPLRPVYRELPTSGQMEADPMEWLSFEGGLETIGHDGGGFGYDNESPPHDVFIDPFQVSDRLVTCGEYLEFVEEGGYRRPELWLSDAWNVVQQQNWDAPLYWEREDARWKIMTLGGMRELNPAEPVCHVSFYEADAFARWKQCWLPRESSWEIVARQCEQDGNFREDGYLHPQPAPPAASEQPLPRQMFGDLWEWTCSPYSAYPGYRPVEGALGEYNGKFMCNQMVLRGGSCVTPRGHIRSTYRNFFPPESRWPFAGFRLTKELL